MGYTKKYQDVPTKHQQVDFFTADGHWVKVDEGIYDVLNLLAQLGVRTYYSCQGDEFSAYVMGNGRDFARLTRKVKRLYRKGRYSMDALETVNEFLGGYKEYELAHYRDAEFERFDGTRGKAQRRDWKLEFLRGSKEPRESYAYERSYSREYGNRTTVRWPKGETLLVKDLLEETLRA